MKTFNQFQENVAAIKGASYALPLIFTGIGAAGTLYQATKKSGPFAGTGDFDASKSRTKRQYYGLPPSSKLSKQEKKDRKITGQAEILRKRDKQIETEGPGDLVPSARKTRLQKLLSDFKKRYLQNLKDKKLKNQEIDKRTQEIENFKKTSKQKRNEKKTRKVENKRSDLANRREWENLKSQGIVSGNYDPNYFNK